MMVRLAYGLLILAHVLLGVPGKALASADLPEALPLIEVGDRTSIPEGMITALAQDKEGFLWIGTTSGLVRFDGYRFKRFVPDPDDANSISGALVRSLLVARDGRLWIGTEADGVSIYNPYSARFSRVVEGEANLSLPAGSVRALAEATDGSVWMGTTGGGLARMAAEGRVLTVYSHDPNDAESLPDGRISALHVDRHGNLWIGTWAGVRRLRAGSQTFDSVLSEPGDSQGFAGTTVRGFFESKAGDLWIGAQQGQMAVLRGAALDGPIDDDALVQRWMGNGLSSAAQTPRGDIWVAHSFGVDVYRGSDRRLLRSWRYRPGIPDGLPNNEVRSLLLDSAGWVWIGTFGGGLHKYDAGNLAMRTRRYIPEFDEDIGQLSAVSVSAASAGGVWAGIPGQAVIRMDENLRIATRHRANSDQPGEIVGQQLGGLAELSGKRLWVGTEAGISIGDTDAGQFKTLPASDYLDGATVRRIWPHGPRSAWVGTNDGLFLVDEAPAASKRVTLSDGSDLSGAINAVTRLPDNDWLVGGVAGIFRVPDGTTVGTPVQFDSDEGRVHPNTLGILTDRQGRVWFDANGLYRVEQLDGTHGFVRAVSRAHNDMEGPFGANLMQDSLGRLWTHQALYSPSTDTLYRLTEADGVLFGTGWFRAFAELPGGALVVGGTDGLLYIDPESFQPWDFIPPVVVSEVRVNGEPRPYGVREVIQLGPNERNLSVEFAALDFSMPMLNRYAYRWEGTGDDRWVEVDASVRTTTLPSVWPGIYQLHVRGSNRVGTFNPQELVVTVEVLPAWWQTGWAIAAWALLATGLVWGVALWRTRRLAARQAMLEREVEERVSELRAMSEALAIKSKELEEASLSDPLTGLRNRRYLMQEMPKDVQLCLRRRIAAERSGEAIADGADLVIFLIDIDHFKEVNDRFGHAAGDALLRQFSDRLREQFRQSDHVARWGGEEFLVVARGGNRANAQDLAERLRMRIESTPFHFDDGTELSRTCCIGFAAFPWQAAAPEQADWEAVVDAADRALYTAKRAGRNAWVGLEPVGSDTASADDMSQVLNDPDRLYIYSNRPRHVVRAAYLDATAAVGHTADGAGT